MMLVYLLQGAIGAGFVMLAFFIIVSIIGIPVLTGVFMRMYWKSVNEGENITNKKPYYKDPLPFIISIVLSIVVLIIFFYLLILILDRTSDYGYYN